MLNGKETTQWQDWFYSECLMSEWKRDDILSHVSAWHSTDNSTYRWGVRLSTLVIHWSTVCECGSTPKFSFCFKDIVVFVKVVTSLNVIIISLHHIGQCQYYATSSLTKRVDSISLHCLMFAKFLTPLLSAWLIRWIRLLVILRRAREPPVMR